MGAVMIVFKVDQLRSRAADHMEELQRKVDSLVLLGGMG